MLTGLALLAACICVGIVIRSLCREWLYRDREVGVDGLKSVARKWLEENGYDILRIEGKAEYVGWVDDSQWSYSMSADFIARKNGREYAVFVTLEKVPETEVNEKYFPLTVILGVHGELFVDVLHERIQRAEFSIAKPRGQLMRQWLHNLAWLSGGALVVFAWLHRM